MKKKIKGISYILPPLIIVVISFNIPLFLMLIRSLFSPDFTFEQYVYLVDHPIYLQILANTFKTAIIVSLLCCLLAYPLAHWITLLAGQVKLFVLGIIAMSFLVSILIRTYAWIVILGNNGIVNRTLLEMGLIGSPLQLIYNDLGVTLGTINVLLPFAIFPLYAAMLKIDKRLIKAAYSLGSKPITVFTKIYLPLTLPTLLSSAILVFIMTLGFFITPAILGGGKVQMVATILDTLINRLANWNLASAISTILLMVTIALYIVYRKVGETVK